MKVQFRYVLEDVDRHGNVRVYFRRRGSPKIRLPGPVGSDEFLAAYKAARDGTIAPSPSPRRSPALGTLNWLCVEYYQAAAFKRLAPSTQRVRRRILDGVCEAHGDKPYALLQARHIRKLRDASVELPEAANALVKALRQLLGFAAEYHDLDHNPARDVPYIATGSEGFHTWTIEEVRQYETRHPIGTKARLALALLLYTGVRRSDVVLFGRQHIARGKLVFTQQKNRGRKPVRLAIPVIPELQRIIDASPCGELTFLVTSFGKPFTSNGFGNRFRKWCDEAGLPQCSAHGLRKALAARLAELGLSELELMAVFGHRTMKEVVRYTRAASQELRADNAMRAFAEDQERNKNVPLSGVMAESGTLPPTKRLRNNR